MRLVIASSDRDVAHLAHHLREAGVLAIGMGLRVAHPAFCAACTRFVPLEPAPVDGPPVARSAPAGALCHKVRALIAAEGDDDGLGIGILGTRMHALHGTRLTDLPGRSWRRYLEANPSHFACDPPAATARVRLR